MNIDTKQDVTPQNRPAEEIRLGSIKAALWRNETESGTRYNVTFERLYRQGEEWRSAGTFGRDDLLLLAKVADLAHSRILGIALESAINHERSGQSDPLSDAAISRIPRDRAKD